MERKALIINSFPGHRLAELRFRARLAGQSEVIYDSLQDPPLSQEAQGLCLFRKLLVWPASRWPTVSRVLNNSDTVKAKNRERVLQAIKESNYQPNLLARQLRTARSNMILVMGALDIANPFCAEVVKGIEEEAEKHGYRILLCNSGRIWPAFDLGLQLLSGKMVDGIIIMNALSSLPELTTMIGDAPWAVRGVCRHRQHLLRRD